MRRHSRGTLLAALLLGLLLAGVACVGSDPDSAVVAMPDGGGQGEDSGRGGPCTSPQLACGGTCVDPATSPLHCGTCDHACASETCSGGVCDDGRAIAVVMGRQHACALRESGNVYCWGDGALGRLGRDADGSEIPCEGGSCQPRPRRVEGLPPVASIAAGYDATCAVARTGEVFCWGANRLGALGVSPGAGESCGEPCLRRPRKIEGLPAASKVSLGDVFGCAKTLDGDVVCWGSNRHGELAMAPDDVTRGPTKIKLTNGVLVGDVVVSPAAQGHACVTTSENAVLCWGSNGTNELGHANTGDATCLDDEKCSPTPRVVTGVAADLVIAGSGFTCSRAPVAPREVRCWGQGTYGVGNVDTSDPPRIVALDAARGLFGRWNTVCGVGGTGAVRCFGDSGAGRLGYNERPDAPRCTPLTLSTCSVPAAAPVPGLLATRLDGFWSGIALTTEGRVVVWGRNLYGQLGHAPGMQGDASCTANSAGRLEACSPVPVPIPSF